MLNGTKVRSYLRSIIGAIDQGESPRRIRDSWWVRNLAVPAAVSLSLGLAGCVSDPNPQSNPSKDQVAEGKADGFLGDLCASIGEEPGCDLCEILGWYGDGECDDFCDQADVDDCGAVAEYGAPFVEVCNDGADNDSDGLIDCADPDCSGDVSCAAARYMAPMAEVCDDGIDNDFDGDLDCDDSDCTEDPVCTASARYMAPMAEVCDDGIDNDLDGDLDCDDADCDDDPACRAASRYMAPRP